MAIPAAPSNFYVQQGNGQVLTSWSITAGATSYSVQRSTDGVTFTVLAAPAVTSYVDTTVTLGSQYWYKVASVNASGTSIYTSSQTTVPTPSGEMSLAEIRLRAQQRADLVNSNFVSLPEWNSYINQSYMELYDLLVTTYEDYYVASPVSFQSNGTDYLYPLPDGTNYSAASAFYKLLGVDLAVNSASNAWVTINKFNFIDRNKFVYPNTASTIYGVFNLRYRLMGRNIEFIPTPSAGQTMRLWYIPRLTQLLQDTDIASDAISGWIEYVIVDAAIKALQKEESDVTILFAQKQALIKRIEDSAMNRDAGQPDTISNVRNGNGWGNGDSGFNGPSGGW